MKNTVNPFIFLLCIPCIFSCDKIEEPVVQPSELDWSLFPDEDNTNYPWPVWSENQNTQINVLLEDYTGHKCVPCFPASQVAEDIEASNPNRIFLTSIHASTSGLFQEVDLDHPTDFTTEAGNAYVNEMPGFLGNPQGTTNRILSSVSSTVWQSSSQWGMNVENALDESLTVNLQSQFNYFPDTRGLFYHVETQFLESVSGQLNLVNYLTRKEVESPQSTPFGLFEEYVHHQVLSNVIGPIWGTNISSGNSVPNEKIYSDFTIQLPDEAIDSTYALQNLTVLSYILNRESYEVLQIIRTDLE